MRKPIGMLYEEKSRLETILKDMEKVDMSNASYAWESLMSEIQIDLESINHALEAIDEYMKNYSF